MTFSCLSAWFCGLSDLLMGFFSPRLPQRSSPTFPHPPGSSPASPLGSSPSPGAVSGPLGGGGLLQRWQQTLLGQVGLQGVEDVELLVHAERQELLDDLGGVGTPEEREKGKAGEGWRQSTTQLIGRTTTRTRQQAGGPAGIGVTRSINMTVFQ